MAAKASMRRRHPVHLPWRALARPRGRAITASAYSWLPGTGLNLIARNATPVGFGFAASMVIAVQMMFVDVAAIAVVPELTTPVFRIKAE
jgi:hypothetical protein